MDILDIVELAPVEELPSIAAEAMNAYMQHPKNEGAYVIVEALRARVDDPKIFELIKAAFNE